MALFRQAFDDLFDHRQKPKIKHLIGFIKDDRGGFIQPQFPAFDMIKGAPRGGDDDIHAAPQGFDLWRITDPAHNDGLRVIDVFAIAADGIRDLIGQFPCRR